MTDNGMGVSFLPGADDARQRNSGGAAPLQQAIQMLSLRMPKVTGAQGLAPGPLLQSPGGSGLLELLRAMFGQGRMQQQPTFTSQSAGAASSLPPSVPPPHVTPANTGGGGQPPRTGPVQDQPRTGTPGWMAPRAGQLGSGAWTGSRTDKYDFNQQGNISGSGF